MNWLKENVIPLIGLCLLLSFFGYYYLETQALQKELLKQYEQIRHEQVEQLERLEQDRIYFTEKVETTLLRNSVKVDDLKKAVVARDSEISKLNNSINALKRSLLNDQEEVAVLPPEELSVALSDSLGALYGGSPEVTPTAEGRYLGNREAVEHSLRAALEVHFSRNAISKYSEIEKQYAERAKAETAISAALAENGANLASLNTMLNNELEVWKKYRENTDKEIDLLKKRDKSLLTKIFTHPATYATIAGVGIGIAVSLNN